MAISTLIYLFALDLSIQWILWAIATFLQTEKFYDLAGSSTFALLVILAYREYSSRHIRTKIQTLAVLIWAFRLGSYLFVRVLKAGHDRRFNEARRDPMLFMIYWTMQGIWVFVTLLPTLMMIMKKIQPRLCAQDFLGWSIWLLGFAIEVVADYQKNQFRSDPDNKNKFITTGLWSISRHPNYLGEVLLWFGLFISASSTFKHWWEYLSVLSPIFVTILITKMSGIPPLEIYGEKKWGQLAEYRSYVANTPVLVPFL